MSDNTKGNLIGLAFVAIAAAIGIYILLAGLGRFGRGANDAPGWVLIAAGSTFLLCALSMGLNALAYFTTGATAGRDGSLSDDAPVSIRAAQILLSLGVVALLATVATWVAFNPGEGGGGRNIAFAIGAAISWLSFAGLAVWRLRRLVK